eukprot:13265950-Heterocapsa_arctica.AAC.1
MFDFYLQRMHKAEIGGVHIIPKHHLALHLWGLAPGTGKPKEFANWYDERLMATFALFAKASYPALHERRVLFVFALAYESQLRQTP